MLICRCFGQHSLLCIETICLSLLPSQLKIYLLLLNGIQRLIPLIISKIEHFYTFLHWWYAGAAELDASGVHHVLERPSMFSQFWWFAVADVLKDSVVTLAEQSVATEQQPQCWQWAECKQGIVINLDEYISSSTETS